MSGVSGVTPAIASGRRAMLEAIRDRLAGILDGTLGHERGCECECGTPWDSGKVPGIVRELRAVILELDDLPASGTGESEFERAQRERAERREAAQRERERATDG